MADDPKRRVPKLDAARQMMRDELAVVPTAVTNAVAALPRGPRHLPHTLILSVLMVVLAGAGAYAAKQYYDNQEALRAEALALVADNMSLMITKLDALPTAEDLEAVAADLDALAVETNQGHAALLSQMQGFQRRAEAMSKESTKALSQVTRINKKFADSAVNIANSIEWKSDQAVQNINAARPR